MHTSKNNPARLNFWSLWESLLAAKKRTSTFSYQSVIHNFRFVDIPKRSITLQPAIPYVPLARNLYAYPDLRHALSVCLCYAYAGRAYLLCKFYPTRRLSSGRALYLSLTQLDDPAGRARAIRDYLRGFHDIPIPVTLKAALPFISGGGPRLTEPHTVSFGSDTGEPFAFGGYAEEQDCGYGGSQTRLFPMDDEVRASSLCMASPGTHWFQPARMASAQASLMFKRLPASQYVTFPSLAIDSGRKQDKWLAKVYVVARSGASASMAIYEHADVREIVRERERLLTWALNHTHIPGPTI